ncbi:hypothetical protein BKA81DRAFT_367476 [Phyllosticta paracitricarpa]|uniref:Uncharacterized protein n=2 Tax=Phyllosticta TaxID=121621 RepID=A0ABR1LFH7_9PEZI
MLSHNYSLILSLNGLAAVYDSIVLIVCMVNYCPSLTLFAFSRVVLLNNNSPIRSLLRFPTFLHEWSVIPFPILLESTLSSTAVLVAHVPFIRSVDSNYPLILASPQASGAPHSNQSNRWSFQRINSFSPDRICVRSRTYSVQLFKDALQSRLGRY